MMMKLSKEIQNLVPYKPGKPISELQRELQISEVVKLASNENPLGANPKVIQAIIKAASEIHRYPDPSSFEVIQKISEKWNLSTKQITLGNASNELIDLLIRIYCEPQDSILVSEYSFVAYEVCAQAARVKIQKAKVNEEFEIDIQDLISKATSDKSIKVLFIANPNNPTGFYLNESELYKTLKSIFSSRDDLLVVLDEAYVEYVTANDFKSGLSWIKEFENLAILRTFSKAYGLAGLRLGALLAHEHVIDVVNKVRNPFNINSLVQAAALVALDDQDYLKRSYDLNRVEKQFVVAELKKMNLKVYSSEGNFLLFDVNRPALLVYQELLKLGVILRPVVNYGLPKSLRFSIGLPTENKKAIAALRQVLQKFTEDQK